jgi:ribosomal 30S subunit maturation factor RimM
MNMKRLLSTTALVIAMAGGAHAETGATHFGQVEMQQGDFYASNLIGMRIYNAENAVANDTTIAADGEAEWDDIGEINDLLVTKDGEVSAVILGVGGFLGMGERDVAIPMDAITIVREQDSNDRFLVVSTTKDALKEMPAFERDTHMKDAADADMTQENADTDMAQADTDAAAMNGDAALRDPLTRPTIEREGYERADMEAVTQMTSDDLEGTRVYGTNDEDVGEIDSLVVGDDGKISKVIIDVGGFLGIGEKPVAVTFDELEVLQQSDGDDLRIYIDSTEDKLETLPKFES